MDDGDHDIPLIPFTKQSGLNFISSGGTVLVPSDQIICLVSEKNKPSKVKGSKSMTLKITKSDENIIKKILPNIGKLINLTF